MSHRNTMRRDTVCAWLLFAVALLFAGLVIGVMCAQAARAAETNWPAAQYLMVDQHGAITPPGYAAGLDEIARAEAQAAAADAAAQAVDAATASASNTVNEIVSVLTGSIGFGYVVGHTVGIGGVVQVSSNATAQIVFCQFGAAGATNISGTAHTGHYIWHAYSETMNAMPVIKYRTNLDATNTWEFAEFQSTSEYTDTTVNGVEYATVYRSTVWLPSSLDSAFFLAFCEIIGGGSAGGMFRVENGFSIGGKVGFTGTVAADGLWWTYQCGALMSVTNEAPQ
ncbi:MAG TPA: hypothetical protein P5026_05505 [Kiritimatiellia bacterium]|nr:hypothetical protein [Kiritimatiellia bacterium]